MRASISLLTVALALGLDPVEAWALEYAGTCRGASATITSIEGLDTPRARVEARHTLPDAISYCHYSLGRAANKKSPRRAALDACVKEFMRDADAAGPLRAEANCKLGTLSLSSGKWSNAYKLPIEAVCADDGMQAISVFNVLCPSYEGKIQADGT